VLRLYATIQKELLILVRDKAGIAILFLMPMAMIIIMALIQDAPFRDYQELNIPLLLINNDKGDLGKTIEKGLTDSKIFRITKIQGDDSILKQSVSKGKYEIGILIPQYSSQLLNAKIKQFVAQKLKEAGLADPFSPQMLFKELQIHIVFAPTTKKSFRSSILGSLNQSATQLEIQTLLNDFSKTINKDQSAPTDSVPSMDFIKISEISTIETPKEALQLNSVQHNVPAWTIFGMFFIVLSLAGSIIKERQDGSYTRLRTMPGSYSTIITGKISAYLFVCLIQCGLMLLVGMYLLPHLGLPQLVIGHNLLLIAVIALCTGLAATGYGIVIGTLFNTQQQSSAFGSVSIVILAALGGIWVPVYVMPHIIRFIADFSPLYWALSAFQKVFLGQGTISDILPSLAKLIAFFLLSLVIVNYYNKLKNR